MEEIQKMDSPPHTPKHKNLLNRIRIIQGQRNLNFSEPHFIESKEYFRQSKSITNENSENFAVHASDALNTSSLLVPNNTPVRTRRIRKRLKALKPNGDKLEDRDEVKTLLTGPNLMCYEYPKEDNRCVRDVLMEGATFAKLNKKKRKKRKREEIEMANALNANHSDTSVKHQEEDRKYKAHKFKVRTSIRKMPEAAGDESDIEDEISSRIGDKFETTPKKKLKNKKFARSRTKDINEIVSSTIAKLNTVEESVQKVIEESLSSGSSFFAPHPDHNTNLEKSPSILEPVPRERDTEQFYVERECGSCDTVATPVTESTRSSNVTVKTSISPVQSFTKKQEVATSTSTCQTAQTSAGLKEISRKQRTDKLKVIEAKLKEVEKAIETRILEKKQPVSSMKKSAKKKKRKEHVNFSSTPEIVPATGDMIPIPLKKKPHHQDVEAEKKKITAPKPANPQRTPTRLSKRRVSSARTPRMSRKKEITKVKSASHIVSMATKEVIQEKLSQEQIRPTEKRSRSRSPKKQRDLKEIYQAVRSNANNAIANINEQMSTTLKESIAHLNEICSKVRTTLSDIEKDEENYKKLKKKKSYDMCSECNSIASCKNTSLVSVPEKQSAPLPPPSPPLPKQMPVEKPQIYTLVSDEPSEQPNLDNLMQKMSMVGDSVKITLKKSEEKITEEPIKKKSRSRKKRPPPRTPKPTTPSTTSSKTKCVTNSGSHTKQAHASIPIWQQKPPSVIDEIQLTVKKQATKSQYRDFIRTLKNIAKKQRSQTTVLPNDFKDVMEKHQDKVFNSLSKHHRTPTKKPSLLVQDTPSKKSCTHCAPDKCTCGVTVQNTNSFPSHQRMQWIQTRSDTFRRGIQSYDILDEITLKDVEPLQSEYPRKDNICDIEGNVRIEETLLYKLLYQEDPKVLETLLKSDTSNIQVNISRTSVTNIRDKDKSVSDAYRMYEQLELNLPQSPSINLAPNKGSLSISTEHRSIIPTEKDKEKEEKENEKEKENQKPITTCSKEFNDNVVIPVELKTISKHVHRKTNKRKLAHLKLKSEVEINSMRSKKRIEDKVKVIANNSSIRSLGKLTKKGKFSKKEMRTKLKKGTVDTKVKMKKVLTVMSALISENSEKASSASKSKEENTQDTEQTEAPDLSISAENMEKISRMSKREVVRTLKPYIFYDLQPPVMIAMPVAPKYNFQNNNQKQDHLPPVKRPSCKKLIPYGKDHDEACKQGRRLCRRCQLLMQCGDEKPEAKKNEPLSSRQLWKNKYRPTTAEKLLTKTLGKKAARKQFETIPPDDRLFNISITPKELNRSATNTRKKLEEVKAIVSSDVPILGQHLDEIINGLEFKIVDVLSDPVNQSTDAFSEIEHEIKSILNTISDLKEINAEQMQERQKFKSKTEIDLAETTAVIKLKSLTETHLNTSNSDYNQEYAVLSTESMETQQTVPSEQNQGLFNNVYKNLSKGIDEVIDGVSTIILYDENKKCEDEKPFSPTDNCELAITSFCDQVDQVIKDLGTIDECNLSTDNLGDLFADVVEKKSDEYLTPFMRAVKTYRQNERTQSFVDFLDKLSVLSQDNICFYFYPNAPLYRANVQQKAHMVEVVKIYNQAVQYQDMSNTIEDIKETIAENVGCKEKNYKNEEQLVECKERDNAHVESQTEVELTKPALSETSAASRKSTKSVAFQDTAEDIYPEETFSKTANKSVGSVESFYEADEGLNKSSQIGSNSRFQTYEEDEENDAEDYVLATNQWMQTDPINLDEFQGEVQETVNQIVQTLPTDEQFKEIEEYINSLQPIHEKDTQIPTDSSHCCFAEIASKDVQVTVDLRQMNSKSTSIQATEEVAEKVSQCQMTSDTMLSKSSAGVHTNDLAPTQGDNTESDPLVMHASLNMEKYASSKIESSYYDDLSTYTLEDYPRHICTAGGYLAKDLERTCEKANSLSEANQSIHTKSEIISLYANRTGYNDDFIEEGFKKGSADSYDSMLARYPSSENTSTCASTVFMRKQSENLKVIDLNPSQHNVIRIKMNPLDEAGDNKLHRHVLHSVYGIVFALMFLGINLNYYSC